MSSTKSLEGGFSTDSVQIHKPGQMISTRDRLETIPLDPNLAYGRLMWMLVVMTLIVGVTFISSKFIDFQKELIDSRVQIDIKYMQLDYDKTKLYMDLWMKTTTPVTIQKQVLTRGFFYNSFETVEEIVVPLEHITKSQEQQRKLQDPAHPGSGGNEQVPGTVSGEHGADHQSMRSSEEGVNSDIMDMDHGVLTEDVPL